MYSLKVRDSALKAIKRYLQTSKSDALAVDAEAATTYLQLLEEQWERFGAAQEEVEVSCGTENIAVEEEARIQGEDWYAVAKSNFKRILAPQKQPTPEVPPTAPARMPLPKLQLPSFSGDPTEWITFHDAFCSLVNSNASLSDGQKLQYLRNCLKGEALELVSSYAVSDSNYSEAWDMLTARYKVMRIIVYSHIKALSSIEKASKDSAKAIKHVLNLTLQHVGALRALKRPVEFWDDWLVHLSVSKLAYETRKQWELSLVTDDVPSFTSLRDFLETRARSLEMVPAIANARTTAKNVLHTTCNQPELNNHSSSKIAKAISCTYCKGEHRIYTCEKFNQLDARAKLSTIKSHGACLNCLSKGHAFANCRSSSSCRICQRRHHTLLHAGLNTNEAAPAIQNAVQGTNVTSHYADAERVVLLATAEILLQDNSGRWQPARALFDNGSHASFITEPCVQRLRLPRSTSSACVTGIGSAQGGRTKGEVKLAIAPRTLNSTFHVSTLILSKITNDLPTNALSESRWPHVSGLPLADPNYFKPGPIDVLIGMDEMDKFLLDGLKKGQNGTPMAQNTAFGWVLFGNATPSHVKPRVISTHYCNTQLADLLTKFWELEELSQRKFYTPEELYCEKLFDDTTQRASDGRFIVRLPLKPEVVIGESRNAAVRALLRMEKRFVVNKGLYEEYSKFMKELLDLGHMELANPNTQTAYYMPHHAVVKETSSTTKLRVVFNASMKTSSGHSLNDAVGPQLQQDLFSILARFRTHRYGIIADIEKMYRQVYVDKRDVDYQRIVWREHPSQPLRDYRLLRVTYGVASASYLAVKSLHRAAQQAGALYRNVARIITADFYMDDLLSKSDSLQELTALQRNISHVLSQCGFELRKWATNCEPLRQQIPHASTQRIWRSNVDWDELVPPEIATDWLAHRKELATLSSLKLNRWLGISPITDAEFHVFTDASEAAYAAAIYCRTQLSDDEVNVVLIAAKTKVAPLKTTSLPRLELCAAHLGAKLVRLIQQSFGHKLERLYAWSDSTITLAWLQSNPSRWATFVANRVADIQEVLPSSNWRHVASEHNPADCASRGLTPAQLLDHRLWWQGPHWLFETNRLWSQHETQHTTKLELKSVKTSSHITQTHEDWDLLTKFHSYKKLKRVTAYILRFINNARSYVQKSNAQERLSGPLTCSEIRKAELSLVKYSQANVFAQEISNCRSGKPIPIRSTLVRHQPFLDDAGILRVGGRIKNASCSNDIKHPMILPKNSPLAKAIAAETDIAMLHAGPQMMQTAIQRQFWIPGIRNLVRGIYRHCVQCKRLNRKPLQQQMSDLPPSRVTSTRCFLQSAVDFSGPYNIKFTHGRGAKSTKAYICSFICMSTGAMHLELAGDLTSASFIAAFKRFTNRRGYCQHMFSDNGTNFVGAERELRAAFERCISDDKLASYFADTQITWHFNPPSAPHMGGYWEAGIKRIKYHLKRALDSSLLSYEEFSTVLTEVEACVNSRPLCWIPSDIQDFEVLTPGHFMVGEPIKGLPEPDLENFKGNLYQRWQAITAIRQHFWKRWRDEYLANLQRRSKWFRPTQNLQRDDVVVIHDNNAPPTKWKLGRVLDSYPGSDDRVRIVNLRTSEGELLRPITKLSLLPTKTDIFSS